MENSEERATERRGLHGKRAFFVVLGSGILAALLVFGVLVGIVRTLGSAVAGPPVAGQGSKGVAPERGPVKEMKVGALDLCQALEQEGLQGDLPERKDDGSHYIDTASRGGPDEDSNRTVSDRCEWVIEPEYNRTLTVELTYKAFVSGGEEGSIGSQADRHLRQGISKLESEFPEGSRPRALEGFGEESAYIFGETSSGERKFVAAGREKSGVLFLSFAEIKQSKMADDELNNELKGKAMGAEPRLFERFDRLLPD
ncbi:hypothetical protein CLV63_10817 [Murinocardiopsis flavida]|uniref:DUF3558 domain-containing protein n=1 Tax=Murinocardiopsis flavida TaxID=645275 RepID=A0A2P8DJE2_9ACTN|nr:hypothetical protein [Murinocardiopsis flavida]PSK97299.1 hypothetical protein CLV63_10817 [Murinocardiopsis flavida]